MTATAITPRSSTPILHGLNGTITEAPAEAGILDGSMALAQLSVSMVSAQNGGDAEHGANFLLNILFHCTHPLPNIARTSWEIEK